MEKEIIYWGIFVDQKQLETYGFPGRLARRIEQPHVTFSFRPKPGTVHNELFGKPVRILVRGYGLDDRNEGLEVFLPNDLQKYYRNEATPHITVSVAADVKPVDTGKLWFEDFVDMCIILNGRIGAFTPEGVYFGELR